MNLYKIKFSHTAPKDQKRGIECLLLAENEEQVYNWLKSDPKLKNTHIFTCWEDKELLKYNPDEDVFVDEDGDEYEEYFTDSDGNPVDFKTKIISIKGEINDEDYDFSDAYYGITLYGWELLKENVTTDYSELIELGVVYVC